jgi:hypothetical protein
MAEPKSSKQEKDKIRQLETARMNHLNAVRRAKQDNKKSK